MQFNATAQKIATLKSIRGGDFAIAGMLVMVA
jgi:hypothetical protein